MKLLILTFSLIAFCVQAATYTVTNTNDSGAGSLRQAVTDANAFGPDVIAFNIPTSDPGYDAVNGVWIISPTTSLPFFTTGNTSVNGSTQTVNQGNTNSFGPEIVIDGTNSITQCFILASPSNHVEGITIQNFTYGLQIFGVPATGNSVENCYFGTGFSAILPASNDIGISISDGASNNEIISCVISGNITAGIAIQASNSNSIFSCKIGCCRNGTDTLPNGIGILLDNSSNNTIGGENSSLRNIISGNLNSGILVNSASSIGNIIIGNYIGTNIVGSEKLSNSFGIILANSGENTIGSVVLEGRNIISGNTESGILINGTGAENNLIINNYIGTDVSGTGIIDNHVGILIKTSAHKNTIGGSNPALRNVISGNSEIGVYIESADSNIVIGNYIGPDATGTGMLMNGDTLFQANGIELNTVSKYNRIGGYTEEERNIISGNRVYGMIYYGQTSENSLIGNYIGTDVSGNFPMPNATGICVDASSNNNYIFNNLLSGNISYGIFLVTNGTYYNQVKGNLIGTNAAGTDSIPNDVGLLLGGGARYNNIGGATTEDRNIISGNRYAGIEIADNLTDYNLLENNFIGTDISGTLAVPNGNGVGITSLPSGNILDGNLISGNTGYGVVIYEFADSTSLINNLIGTDVSGTLPLPNTAGIVLATGTKFNQIGNEGSGNIIAFNESVGIIITENESLYNTISANSTFSNGSGIGIEIFPFGPNTNDAGDTDAGPNNMMNYPEISDAFYYPSDGQTYIYGTLETTNPEQSVVEVFIAEPGVLNYGEGKTYLGKCYPDASGNWHAIVGAANISDLITATATDNMGNTSEFSYNYDVIVNLNSNSANSSYSIFPNPASDNIFLICDHDSQIEIISSTGIVLLKNEFKAGRNIIQISNFAPAVYFLKVKTSESVFVEKINIIK